MFCSFVQKQNCCTCVFRLPRCSLFILSYCQLRCETRTISHRALVCLHTVWTTATSHVQTTTWSHGRNSFIRPWRVRLIVATEDIGSSQYCKFVLLFFNVSFGSGWKKEKRFTQISLITAISIVRCMLCSSSWDELRCGGTTEFSYRSFRWRTPFNRQTFLACWLSFVLDLRFWFKCGNRIVSVFKCFLLFVIL